MWRVIADLLLLNLAFIISRVVGLLDLRNMFLEIRAQRERHEKKSKKKFELHWKTNRRMIVVDTEQTTMLISHIARKSKRLGIRKNTRIAEMGTTILPWMQTRLCLWKMIKEEKSEYLCIWLGQ